MSRIVSVQSATIETPMVADIKTTYGSWTSQPHVIVRLAVEDGTFGLGEASTLGFFTGETPQIVRAAIEHDLAAVLVGRDPLELEAALAAMDARLPRNASAKAALDMALHDLAGKLLGAPVYVLLGGKHRARIPCATAVGIRGLDEMRAEARAWTGRGFRTLKLKIGLDPERDERMVAAVREVVGPAARIRVDANQGYTPRTAAQVGRRIERYGIEYMEQPVPAWDVAGLAEVRRSVGMPVAADESLYTLQDALRLIEERAVDVFVIKMIKVGGLNKARRIARLAEAAGVSCVAVSPLETALGTAAGAHWAAALGGDGPDHELVGPLFLRDDPFTGARIEGNELVVPDGPGLGAALSREIFD